MLTPILKSLKVENFGPFAESIVFSTVSDISKKELITENTFQVQDIYCNKISYIFGANGAGKSNFCKAILQIQNYLSLAPFLAANNPQILEMAPIRLKSPDMQNFFKFDKSYENKPTAFQLEILVNGIAYTYSFTVHKDKILAEKLTKKNRRTETILERTSPSFSDIKVKSELKSFENNLSVVKENVLSLSMAAFLNIPIANELVGAIQSIEVINMAALRSFSHITEETCTSERIEKYLDILRIADPTLRNLHVEFNEKKVERQRMSVPDLEDRELVVKSVQVDVASTHSIYDGDKEIESGEFPFLQIESNGTIKLFGVLPVIFDALENGSIIVIDEIENGLHPNLVKQIVELFRDSKTNPKNAQLVCTTHNETLIAKNVRRDQVWIITKNKKGISSMKRVSDIPGMRAYEKSGQKYLENAFGDIPLAIFDNIKN